MNDENELPDDRLHQLLELWDDLRKQGLEPSPEELCQNDPQLLEELRKRIDAIKATNWLEKPFDENS